MSSMVDGDIDMLERHELELIFPRIVEMHSIIMALGRELDYSNPDPRQLDFLMDRVRRFYQLERSSGGVA